MHVLIAIALVGAAAWAYARLARRAGPRDARAGENDKEALRRWEDEGGATPSHTTAMRRK